MDALTLFNKNQVLSNKEENNEEKEHFMYIVANVAAKAIAEARPAVSKFKSLLPKHHKHKNSVKKKDSRISIHFKASPLPGN